MDDIVDAIVIDNGSGLLKAGFAGEDTPRSNLPTCIGKVRNLDTFASQEMVIRLNHLDRDRFVGSECQLYREYLDIASPITRGIIEDWDALESIWECIFTHELHINPEALGYPILCTSSPSGSKQQLERMAEIMFESQKVSGFYHVNQSALSLFASGRTRGVVVEVGHGTSHVTPIFEGYALPHATLAYNIGGLDVSQRLQKQLTKHGHSFHSFHLQTIHDMKESLCWVPCNISISVEGKDHDKNQVNGINESATLQNSGETSKLSSPKLFELPDGTVIHVDPQICTQPGEMFFDSTEMGDDFSPQPPKTLPTTVLECIEMCDKDLQKDLYNNIILAGGTTMLPGFPERCYKEICKLLDTSELQDQICCVPQANIRERGYNTHRKIASWIGGSIFSSLSTFRDIYITKQEWEEYHHNIVDRKCF